MQFTTATLITLLSALGAASPLQPRQLGLCSSAIDTAQCCSVSILGVANLNCVSPHVPPTSVESFREICAAHGQQASCCAVPVAGQAVLCTAASA
ncbi:predicted protein [Sclerotinia sclerotiorum 1980 UF-70]|uniref:Hydrophobin n=2 Tax=Sclerotinia sclerotiorum (strain ATCC 18683 / 1980 / Ss-1) TaxID=665079 RepID=A0A1D9QLS8_SCLS1|nr:predicted protein [Sclerotinia sclerotiorum 1980 UF-70]APA15871.1 hypothetical protein sscle_15g106410 [Sclerotinia sclerotiorum 1980 UF-70]EDN93382.1 predicted protein [Sclerotinia sclerotiorum 1980 UF-70]